MGFRKVAPVLCGCWILALLLLVDAGFSHAAGIGVRGGVGLLQQEDLVVGGATNGPTLWMIGGYVDLGGVVSSRLRVTPGVDYGSRSGTRITSVNLEARYQVFQGPKAIVYVGMGPGINLKRRSGTGSTGRTVKGSLNVPIGLEWKLGKGAVRWTLEMKMAIADDQRDSAYRLGTGFAFVLK